MASISLVRSACLLHLASPSSSLFLSLTLIHIITLAQTPITDRRKNNHHLRNRNHCPPLTSCNLIHSLLLPTYPSSYLSFVNGRCHPIPIPITSIIIFSPHLFCFLFQNSPTPLLLS